MTRYASFVEDFENRFGDDSWRKARGVGLGIIAFVALCTTAAVRGDTENPCGLTAQGWLLIAAIATGLVWAATFLSWSDSVRERDYGAQGFFANALRAIGWVALTLSVLAASAAFCYVSAKGTGARQTIVVLSGRTNVHGGFFKPPFARVTRLKDFTVTTQAVGVKDGKPVTATLEATFRIRTDDEAAIARFVASHPDPEGAMRQAAEAHLQGIWKASVNFTPRTLWHTTETDSIEMEPQFLDRMFDGEKDGPLWLVGDIKVSDMKFDRLLIERPFRD